MRGSRITPRRAAAGNIDFRARLPRPSRERRFCAAVTTETRLQRGVDISRQLAMLSISHFARQRLLAFRLPPPRRAIKHRPLTPNDIGFHADRVE